jgi:hypothetical protein
MIYLGSLRPHTLVGLKVSYTSSLRPHNTNIYVLPRVTCMCRLRPSIGSLRL